MKTTDATSAAFEIKTATWKGELDVQCLSLAVDASKITIYFKEKNSLIKHTELVHFTMP